MKNINLSFLYCLCSFFLVSSSFAQADLLRSGPMVGYSEMREVMLWVQTKTPAKVKIAYFDQANPSAKLYTKEILTDPDKACATHLVATVEPGIRYQYELYINDQLVNFNYPLTFQSQALWHWRTDPPNFKFAFGSCAYTNEDPYDRPGKPYGGEYVIYQSIFDKHPDFMIWGGDNIYLREPDWNTRTGILHRYTHFRSLPEIQPLWASVHHYAIWDDHDFGPNDSDRGFWMKEQTFEAFKLFWANPNYNLTGQGGITGTFFWNDVQFFLLDNRYFRSPNNLVEGDKEMFGKAQLQWLIDALTYSQASFKVIVTGGQLFNNALVYENYINHHAEEREIFLNALRKANIPGVVVLSGDRHHTEMTKFTDNMPYPFYEITISPLTSGSAGDRAASEPNNYRIPGTYFGDRNFSMVEVSGELKNRKMTITVFDNKGGEVWKQEILAQDLK